MKAPRRMVIAASLLGFACSPVHAQSIVDDTFQSAASRTSGTLAADRANWFVLSPNSSNLASATGGSSGTALTVTTPTGSSSSMAYMARWTPVTLEVGETLTVKLTVSFSGLPASQGFRLGVLNSGSDVITGDVSSPNNTTFVNDTGYAWAANSTVAIGTSPSVSTLFALGERTTLTSGNVFSTGADFTQLQSGNGTNAAWASGTQYSFTMAFTLVDENDLRINAILAGGAFGTGVSAIEAVDTSPSTTTFDYLLLRQANANAITSVTFHELQVALTSASAIPEPSTYAALFGASALGLALWRRRGVVRTEHS